MKTRKPTRRQILRKLVYKAMRERRRRSLETLEHEYNSSAYGTANWQEQHEHGRIAGLIDAAEALGVLGFSEASQWRRRASRHSEATSTRWQKLHADKYRALNDAT